MAAADPTARSRRSGGSSRARLIAGLARMVRDVGLAEELAQDALVAALEQWPSSGVPDNPGAWLMATAKHRAIDLMRRERAARAQARSSSAATSRSAAGPPPGLERRWTTIGDDLLRLVLHLPATRCSRARRGWRSRCGCSAGSRPTRSRGRSSSPSRRSRSGSSGRSATLAEARGAVRGAARATSSPTRLAVGARGGLPGLQRGLRGDRRRRLDAPGAVRGRAAARPHPGRAGRRGSRRCTGWSR